MSPHPTPPLRERRPGAPAVAIVLSALAGCVYPRLVAPLAVTTAFDRPAETPLGLGFAERAVEHPGASALYVLSNGLDAFVARVGLIDAAEHAIDLQVYILHDDVTGLIVIERLLAAADRGVRVRVLLDDMGTRGLDDVVAAADVHANLEVRLFNPFARGPLPGVARALDLVFRFSRLNRRMHNKLMTADGAAGIVGGRNVGDEYFDAHDHVNFADLDLLAFGPVVEQLGQSFDLYWNSPFAFPPSAWPSLRRDGVDLALLQERLALHSEEHKGSPYAERLTEARMVRDASDGTLDLLWAPTHVAVDLPQKIEARGGEVSGTLLGERIGEHIPQAHSELLVISPYFVPRANGARYLVDQVAAGVSVTVLTNSLAATDSPIAHSGYARYRARLLTGGVELFELRPNAEEPGARLGRGRFGSSEASLHAKTFCFDRRTVYVGSLNLDPRSVDLNTELGLVVASEELAERIATGFEASTAPDRAWRLSLVPRGEGTRLVWHGADDGRPIELYRDPETSWWKRCRTVLLGLLPIEGQL